VRSRYLIGSEGGSGPVIFCTRRLGWYLSVRSPVNWRWPWRYRLRLGWDSSRRWRLAGHVEARRTRPWKWHRWDSRPTLIERYACFLVWLEESGPARFRRGLRGAWAYRGGLSRRRVFGYYSARRYW